MPCEQADHTHEWPQSGPLTIQRCEVYCQYCRDEEGKNHRWKYAWFLRRHVTFVHTKRDGASHPNVIVNEGWKDHEEGNARPARKKAARRAKSQARSSSTSNSPSPSHSRSSSGSMGSEVQVALPSNFDPSDIVCESFNGIPCPTGHVADVFCAAPALAVNAAVDGAADPTLGGIFDQNALATTNNQIATSAMDMGTLNPAALNPAAFNGNTNNMITYDFNPTAADLPSSVDNNLS